MTIAVVLLLALTSITLAWQNMPVSLDSIEDGYQMIVRHDPWWGFETSDEDLGSSYQYYYPYYANKKFHTSSYNRIRMPTFNQIKKPTFNQIRKPTYNRVRKPTYNRPVRPPRPPPPAIQPSPPAQSDMSTREWPSWIPPIRLIKLPLDEPPAAID